MSESAPTPRRLLGMVPTMRSLVMFYRFMDRVQTNAEVAASEMARIIPNNNAPPPVVAKEGTDGR